MLLRTALPVCTTVTVPGAPFASGPVAFAWNEYSINLCPGAGEKKSCIKSGSGAPGAVLVNLICRNDVPRAGGAPFSVQVGEFVSQRWPNTTEPFTKSTG